MSNLRLLGAMVLKSGISTGRVDNERLQELITAAREEITTEEDSKQFDLWKACGDPHFDTVGRWERDDGCA